MCVRWAFVLPQRVRCRAQVSLQVVSRSVRLRRLCLAGAPRGDSSVVLVCISSSALSFGAPTLLRLLAGRLRLEGCIEEVTDQVCQLWVAKREHFSQELNRTVVTARGESSERRLQPHVTHRGECTRTPPRINSSSPERAKEIALGGILPWCALVSKNVSWGY